MSSGGPLRAIALKQTPTGIKNIATIAVHSMLVLALALLQDIQKIIEIVPIRPVGHWKQGNE